MKSNKSLRIYLHIPIPSPSKESNKGLRIYPRKHRSVKCGAWPQVSPRTLAPRSQFRAGVSTTIETWWGGGELTDSSLLASFPLTPLLLEYLDYILDLKRSSVPNVSLKAVTPLKEKRKKERRKRKRERERVGTGFFQRTRVPPQRAGKPEQRSAPAYLFAIYKENQLICCHCHRLRSLHSRYLTPSRHWQVSQLWNLNNMPPLKMKGSQPMGGNQLRASGHEEFLAKATGLHNQGKCKQSFSANHTPNTCVKEHAGRHRTSKDISPEARRPWLLSTALVAPASPTGLQKIEKEEGPSSGSGQHSWLIPSISTLLSPSAFIAMQTQPYMQDSFSFRLEDYRGHRMWCPAIQMKTWHLTSASRLSPSELSCFHRVNGRMNGTKSRRLRGSRYILEVLCKFAKNQNVYYYY